LNYSFWGNPISSFSCHISSSFLIFSILTLHNFLFNPNSYFPLKIDKENEANARKAKAQQDIKTYISVLIAMIIALTLISMILVLMAIERNTRREFKN